MEHLQYGEIILPEVIHIAAGRECCLWWSTISNTEEDDRSVYFETKCAIGKCTRRAFVIHPTAEQCGDYPFTVRCRDLRTREILGEQTVTIRIVPQDAGTGHRNILMLGDSRTWHTVEGVQGKECIASANKTTTAELRSLLADNGGSSFTFYGTKKSERDENVCNLADNGWQYRTAYEYLNQAGGVRAYLEKECGMPAGETLDYVTMMYGINDLADWHQNNLDQFERSKAKIGEILMYARKLIDLLLADYPDCRIVLALESSTAGNQDGFGYWGASDADCQVEWEFAVKALRRRTIAEFDGGRYSRNVTVSAAGLWCDRIYGYPYLIVPQSERSAVSQTLRLINCVHPHDAGYRQIADGYFSTIRYLESVRNV